MTAPCKVNGIDCQKRYPGCHSKCKEYITFDKENQKRRAERLERIIAANPSPNKISRMRRYEVQRMRGNY